MIEALGASHDDLLAAHPEAKEKVREVHPEVCFWSFSGNAMSHKKSESAGFGERRKVLTEIDPDAEAMIRSCKIRRSEVARDDLVDAMVAMLTAEGGRSQIRTLPEAPETDSCGLRMEMVYRIGGGRVYDFGGRKISRVNA